MKTMLKLSLIVGFVTNSLTADWFLHRATSGNVFGHISSLPEHLTDDSELELFLQPIAYSYYPDHLDQNFGLYFAANRWNLFHEFTSPASPRPFEQGTHFSIYRPEAGDTVFSHTHVASSQSNFKRSYLDHPDLNNNPAAVVFTAHNWTAGGGIYNNQFSYIGYDTSSNRWYIYGYIPSDEFTDIPDGATWNIMVRDASDSATYIHTVTNSNRSSDLLSTELDHADLNGNPNAHLLISQVYAPSTGMTFAKTQARYNSDVGRWQIESLSNSQIGLNSKFHIFVAPASSVPASDINASVTGSTATISVPSEFDYSYQLETDPELSGSWQNEGLSFEGTGETIEYPTTVILPKNFYRIDRSLKPRL